MAREFAQSKFFDHSRYTNVYYASQIPLEYFIANVLLRGDLSRVVFTSDDMIFRRRFQTADAQNGGNINDITPSSLNFPFAGYWYNGFWTPDDRIYSVQPMQMIRGTWEAGLPDYLRAMAVKNTFDVTALYARDDDARLAYEALLWEKIPKGPVQFSTRIKWKDVDLLMPTFFTIEDITFNDQYKEGDWLKQQRIIPFKFSITCRTYSIYMPAQLDVEGWQRDRAPYSTGAINTETVPISITEEVILQFAASKGWGTLTEEFATEYDAFPVDDPDDPDEEDTPYELIQEVTDGYFAGGKRLDILSFEVDPASITDTSCTITWEINPDDIIDFQSLKILIPGQDPIFIDDPAITSYTIDRVFPSSEYHIVGLFASKFDTITDFHITCTTLEDPNNPVGTPLVKRRGRLKGMTW
jgi:hypothetical protein